MPNSQTHMVAACDLLAGSSLRLEFPWLADPTARSAFLLGVIGPDVRAISGQTREETHFFAIPPDDPRPAHVIMVDMWPVLHGAAIHDRIQAAFIAGYMTHLIMDQTWVEMIVMPALFIDGHRWGLQHPNWRVYSILMTYLEYQAAARFPAGAVTLLARAEPHGWLPFVRDRYLAEWRDHVASHIREGGARRISEMFARSNGISPGELEAIVLSEERMEAEAFHIVPRERLAVFQQEAARRSESVALAYLRGVSITDGEWS